MPADVPRDVLRAALLGDREVQDSLDEYGYRSRRINWPNCLALASLVIGFVVMVFWPNRKTAKVEPLL